MAGNSNSGTRKAKLWRDALMLVLNRPEDEPVLTGRTTLHRLISTQINLALGGDSQSIRDIADRIDGKPAQAIIGGDDDDNPVRLEQIKRVIIDRANNPDSESIPAVTATEQI